MALIFLKTNLLLMGFLGRAHARGDRLDVNPADDPGEPLVSSTHFLPLGNDQGAHNVGGSVGNSDRLSSLHNCNLLLSQSASELTSESCFPHLESAFRISVVNSNTAEEGTPAE